MKHLIIDAIKQAIRTRGPRTLVCYNSEFIAIGNEVKTLSHLQAADLLLKFPDLKCFNIHVRGEQPEHVDNERAISVEVVDDKCARTFIQFLK